MCVKFVKLAYGVILSTFTQKSEQNPQWAKPTIGPLLVASVSIVSHRINSGILFFF